MNNSYDTRHFMSKLVLIITILIIVSNKIDIFSIGAYSQGIRFEDLAILFLGVIYLPKIKGINVLMSIIFVYLLFITFLGFLNANVDIIFTILSYLRLIEYFVFFVIIKHYLSRNQLLFGIYFVFFWEFFLTLFQFYNGMYRAIGSTAGPWELAMICVSGFILLTSFKHKYNSKMYFFIFLFLTLFVLYASSARVQILSFIIIIFIKIIYSRDVHLRMLLLFLAIFTIIYGINLDLGYISFSESFRFINNHGKDFIYDLITGSRVVDLSHYSDNWGEEDLSLIARFHHWRNYIMLSHEATLPWVAYLFGSGLNSGGMTTDGMYIKIFVDTGIVGLLAFFVLLFRWLKDKNMILFVVLIAVSSITLDWLWASKYMYFMMVILAYLKKTGNASHKTI